MNTALAREEFSNRIIDRMAIVRLDKNDPREFIDLSWNAGRVDKQIGRRTKKLLRRGETVTIPLDRAVAFFGPFMILQDLEENELDEKRHNDAIEHFQRERSRALLTWGDYPRAHKLSDPRGNEPIGAHRFPHVHITIVDIDGEKSDEFDLHEVYSVGEFDVPTLRPSYFKNAEPQVDRVEELEDENKNLRSRLSKIEGQLEVLLAERSGKAKAS